MSSNEDLIPRIGNTILVKLLYLADIESRSILGRSLSTFNYRWDQYGPYDPQIIELATSLCRRGCINRKVVIHRNGDWGSEYTPTQRIHLRLGEFDQLILDSVIRQHFGKSVARMKNVAYKTVPMQDAKKRKAVGKHLNMSLVDNTRPLAGLELDRVWQSHAQVERGELLAFSDVLARAKNE
jgi:hypothetical protein